MLFSFDRFVEPGGTSAPISHRANSAEWPLQVPDRREPPHPEARDLIPSGKPSERTRSRSSVTVAKSATEDGAEIPFEAS